MFMERKNHLKASGLTCTTVVQATKTGAASTLKNQKQHSLMNLDEVAKVLGYDKEYLRKKCAALGFTRNGVKTELSEKQVTELKSVLIPRTSEMKVRGERVPPRCVGKPLL